MSHEFTQVILHHKVIITIDVSLLDTPQNLITLMFLMKAPCSVWIDLCDSRGLPSYTGFRDDFVQSGFNLSTPVDNSKFVFHRLELFGAENPLTRLAIDIFRES